MYFYRKQPDYTPQMQPGRAYDKGVRKDQLTGSYGDFRPALIKSGGERYPTDVVYFKTAESEGRVWHSTQKPVELGRYLVRTYTSPGHVLLDNCFGSGSFLVAAAMEGRDSIGIEKNRDIDEFRKGSLDLMEVARERLAPLADVTMMRKNQQEAPDLEELTEFRDGNRLQAASDVRYAR